MNHERHLVSEKAAIALFEGVLVRVPEAQDLASFDQDMLTFAPLGQEAADLGPVAIPLLGKYAPRVTRRELCVMEKVPRPVPRPGGDDLGGDRRFLTRVVNSVLVRFRHREPPCL